ncbi:non-specific serine/threonine protein kinase [Ranunculus cassubicifolius]
MIDKDHSHVSLTSAQGTPGYAAPEMWLKSYGPVTEKSDVYSYGMLLLEMVGGRKNYDSEVVDSSETYFPEWLYNKMERNDFSSVVKQDNVGDEKMNHNEDEAAIWKMSLVSLWCIQYNPSNRPFMNTVVQMLEGHVEIGIPPNPFPH